MRRMKRSVRKRRMVTIGTMLLFSIMMLSMVSHFTKNNMEYGNAILRTAEEVCLELENEEGHYNEKHIVARNMPQEKLERFSKELDAEYKTTKDGNYAVLYLDSDNDIRQVSADRKYKDYVG